ncbi:MAG: hypothetical protein H6618_02460 [Deltaproteobacteria bacterium]|nr:hypothetical protein [Deltaproteobacteria bacterium]
MQNIVARWSLIFFFSVYFYGKIFAHPFLISRDHSTSEIKSLSDDFIEETFKENGLFSSEKADAFIQRLIQERNFIEKDLYETKFTEKVNIDVKTDLSSHTSALKNKNTHPIIFVFDEYLLPMAKIISERIRENDPSSDRIQAAIDTFIRGYLSFFSPKAHRTYWNYDKDMSPIIKNMFRSHYIRKKNNEKNPDAINLVTSDAYKEQIAHCLGYNIKAGKFLTPDELRILKSPACHFDLSLLDPGISPFWTSPDPEYRKHIGQEYREDYPDKSTKITFKRVRFKGNFSPKITGLYRKSDRFYKVKIKFGPEVHTEIAVSMLGQYAGFNHDHMRYEPMLKIWLGDLSYEDFRSRFIQKYGLKDLIRLVISHGKDPGGEEWFVLNDALIEIHPDDELRVSSADPGSWDLPLRREFRGHLLWKAWLNINDTKAENYKFILKKTEEGMKPLIRLQDTGFALGPCMLLRKPSHILNISDKYKVNEFEKSMIKTNSSGDIKIRWNDFYRKKSVDKYSDWNDLKWMARKIASISSEEIKKSLYLSGMPDAVQRVYSIKIMQRRNEIIKSFQLEKEYDLFEIPDLKSINIDGAVKKGRVVQTAFEGKNDFVLTQQTWITFLTGLLGSIISQDTITQRLNLHYQTKVKNNQSHILNNHTHAEADLPSAADHQILGEHSLGTGISVSLSRSVGISPQLLSAPDKKGNMKGHPYMITDTLSFNIGVSSGLLNKLLSWFPVSVSASFEVFKMQFQMIQFAETVKKAYLRPFRLFRLMKNPAKYALVDMKPLEVWRQETAWGISLASDVDARFPVKDVPVISSGAGAAIHWIQSHPKNILKDQYGSIHLIQEAIKSSGASGRLNLLDLNIVATRRSLLHIAASIQKQKQNLQDFVLSPPGFDRYLSATAIGEYHYKKYYKKLKNLIHHPSHLPFDQSLNEEDGFIKKFQITGYHKTKIKDFHIGFIFDYFRQKSSDAVMIERNNGDKKSFIRQSVTKKSVVGIEKITPDFGEKNILVPLGNSKRLWIEMDEDNPMNCVGVIDVTDYHRSLKRDGVYRLINELNRRYSPEGGIFYEERQLPDEIFAPKYKKIYAKTRILIDGGTLLERIRDQDYQEFKEFVRSFFSKENIQTHCNIQLNQIQKKALFFRRRTLFKKFLKIQNMISAEHRDHRKMASALLDFIYAFYNSNIGTKALEQYLGSDGMLVIGEIYGIHRSYSNLQDLQQLTARRYMAQHWGKLQHLPPVQHYLRYEKIFLPSELVKTSVSQSDYLGELYSGLPGNFTGL